MFQFAGCPPQHYVFMLRWWSFTPPGFPIRMSTAQCLLAAPRSFSQLATSFFGGWCQGIHPVLFLAWSSPTFLVERNIGLVIFQSNVLVKTRLILFLSFHCAVFKVREFSFISPFFTEKLEPQSDPSKRYSQELSNSLVSLNVLASLCCLVRHSNSWLMFNFVFTQSLIHLRST